MPRFAETRFIAAVVGLAAGLAVTFGASPASAQLVTLNPGESGTVSPAGTSPGPLALFGNIGRPNLAADGSFSHTFTFTVDLGTLPEGEGFVSVIPNVLPPNGVNNDGMTFIAGFATFMGSLELPDGSTIPLTRSTTVTPRENPIAAEFAAINGETYVLTITGTLLDTVLLGNYTGNIGVTPLPGAALVLLSALGGLIAVRRYRSQAATAAA